MGGNTGNLRTLRISATGGTRTLYSMIADSASAGAGSFQRQYKYVKSKNPYLANIIYLTLNGKRYIVYV